MQSLPLIYFSIALGIIGLYKIVMVSLKRTKTDIVTDLLTIILSILYSIVFLLIDLEIIKASVHLYWGVLLIVIGGIVKQVYLYKNGTSSQQAEAGKKLLSVVIIVVGAIIIIGAVSLTR